MEIVVTSKTDTFVYKGTVKGYNKQVLLTLTVIPFPEEVSTAISYGFVLKDIQSDLGTAITFSQYCAMLSKMIALYDASLVPKLNTYVKLALKSQKQMKREDGIMVEKHGIIIKILVSAVVSFLMKVNRMPHVNMAGVESLIVQPLSSLWIIFAYYIRVKLE